MARRLEKRTGNAVIADNDLRHGGEYFVFPLAGTEFTACKENCKKFNFPATQSFQETSRNHVGVTIAVPRTKKDDASPPRGMIRWRRAGGITTGLPISFGDGLVEARLVLLIRWSRKQPPLNGDLKAVTLNDHRTESTSE
ncbi:hypothetical protein LBW59_04510 [Ralstonia solanacearum]|uniref:Uncharacterized protein n=1 Tax=Ralstonia solanacearum TaxID=305 RepID=A0AAW5ZJ04_RALSL|nr:hypothetical protein [Ralstonia solanacearum]MDB0570037.1 hypothetical protein [Ralstonia solanacearum]